MCDVKKCGACKNHFHINEILQSRDFRPVGIQMAPEGSDLHGMYFVHDVPECIGSFMIRLKDLEKYISENIPALSQVRPCGCEDLCRDPHEQSPCYLECYLAPFRRFVAGLIRRREEMEAAG